MPSVRQAILETLSQRGPLHVGEIARAVSHSPMATRYHLALLVQQGLVIQHDCEHRGAVGRPHARYALVDQGYECLPMQYGQLAGQLLGVLTQTLGDRQTRALLRRAGRRAAEAAPPLRPGARPAARFKAACRFLVGMGYRADWSKQGDEPSLVILCCPYRQVARQYDAVCQMDLAMIGALLDGPVRLTQCIADGCPRCRFDTARES